LLAVVVVSSPGLLMEHHQMVKVVVLVVLMLAVEMPQVHLLTETEDLEPVVAVVQDLVVATLQTMVVMVDQALSWFVIKSDQFHLQKQLVAISVSITVKRFIHS
tara:strand:+ start:312 stop:623 length:312 start_codon:yes stop_codon:yes gene_type:complete